jgi:para-aminobenzoate synthetase / 4-amino-4-deoxychorismate lyase
MNPSDSSLAPGRVVLRDAERGRWLEFSRPREFVAAAKVSDVTAGLRRVEAAVATGGLYAAGFVAYEAAPAFDPALQVRSAGGFPLLWFGLYECVEEIDLPAAAAGAHSAWQPSVTSAEYLGALARIKALIQSGDTYQVNYTFRLTREATSAGERSAATPDPWALFLQLAAAQESPFSAYIDAGEWVICSASPELFFRLDGERLESRPMKGTAARGLTAAQDRAQAAALGASEKDRAENVMIVDMVRHDLGRIARAGSVQVTSLCAVEKYPTVWQMTSTVEGLTGASLSEVFGALFPAASITGAPKVHTMELIAQIETTPRRLYTGAIGFVLPGRRAQFNVAIRTVLVHRPSGHTEYGVGGGIVWDSEPEKEWRECAAKAKVLEPLPPPFSVFEAMLWTPAGGYWLLERHLERLAASADYFGFPLNRTETERELEQLAVRLSSQPPAARVKVRLLLAKDGSMKLEAQGLPEPTGKPLRVALAAAPVNSSDPFLYHKTTHRAVYEAAIASRPGYDAVLLYNERGDVTEFTRANVAIELGGKLVTPPVSCGLLAGTLRVELLARGELVEQPFTVEQLLHSPRVLFINSVRGVCPVEIA